MSIVDGFRINVEPLLVAALATKGVRLVASQSSAVASRRGPVVASSVRVLLSYCAQLIQMDPFRNVVEVRQSAYESSFDRRLFA